MDKNTKCAKTLALLNWLIIALIVVVLIFTGANLSSLSDKMVDIEMSDSDSFSIGLGLGLGFVYSVVFYCVYIFFQIPTAICKNISYKKGRVCIADIVFTCLSSIWVLPLIFCYILIISAFIDLLAYGMGLMLIPCILTFVAQIVLIVFNIIKLFKGKNNKQQELTEEVAVQVESN